MKTHPHLTTNGRTPYNKRRGIRTLLCLLLIVAVLALSGCRTDKGESAEISTVESSAGESSDVSSEDSREESSKEEASSSSSEEDSKEESSTVSTEESEELVQARQKAAKAGCACGVIDLGFVEEPEVKLRFEQLDSRQLSAYPFITSIPDNRIASPENGTYNVFCFVPAEVDAKVKVCENSLNMDGQMEEGKVLYQSSSGEPFIVRCMVGDLYTNVQVTVEGSSSSLKAYMPAYSGRDGSLLTEAEDGTKVLNLTAGSEGASEEGWKTAYEEILDGLYEDLSAGYEEADYADEEMGLFELWMMDPDNILSNAGYLIQDMNGDQVPELLIGYAVDSAAEEEDSSQSQVIYDLYTYKEEAAVLVFNGWYRSCYQYLGDGRFYYYGSNSAFSMGFGAFSLSEDTAEPVWEEFYFSDNADSGSEETIAYYYNTTGSWEASSSVEQTMTREDFDSLRSSLAEKTVALDYHLFADYHGLE